MFMQWHHRDRDTIEDLVENIVSADIVGERFIGEDDAVAHHVQRHVEHILGQGIFAAAHKGQGPAGQDQVDRRTRAGAEHDVALHIFQAHLLRLTGCGHHADGIFHQGRVHIHLIRFLLEFEQISGGEDFLHGLQGAGHALDDDELLRRRGISHKHLHHEAVHLGFRKGIRPFSLDRVLGGQHKERIGHLEGLTADGHLFLLHDFKQGALHLGGRTVDLVGQQQVGEHRTKGGLEGTGLLVVDARPDQVGRHKIGCELDALELSADRLCQGLDRHGLRQARHTLDEDVAACQQGDDHPLEHVVLPDDDLLHFI